MAQEAETEGKAKDRQPAEDAIQHPAHYTSGGIECIDAMEAALTPEQLEGYLRGNVLKYLWRYPMKGQAQDLRKARWYLDELIGAVEKGVIA